MDPILLDLPTKIETERLVLRIPQPGDGKVVNQAICESIEELRPWLSFAKKKPSIEETEADVRIAHAHFFLRKEIRFHIYSKADGRFIGTVRLHHPSWKVPRFELGYWIHTKESGKGYITEAVEALVQYAVEEVGAKRIECLIGTDNKKSCKIPEKLGFTLEGILKNEYTNGEGVLIDSYVYALTPGR
ncbi:GNAT family N-acetyltransferase [Bacillus carboniphilus]